MIKVTKMVFMVLIVLVLIFVMNCFALAASLNWGGFSPHGLEKSDAIFHRFFGSGSIEIFHVGIYTGFTDGIADDLHNHKTAELLVSGYAQRDLERFIHGSEKYMGGRTLNLSVFQRWHIAATATDVFRVRKDYVKDPRTKVIEWIDGYNGNPKDGQLQLEEITGIRCDGFVELIYALNDVNIQGDIIKNTNWYNELTLGLITKRSPMSLFDAMNWATPFAPDFNAVKTSNSVVNEGDVVKEREINVTVSDGSNGSGLCCFEVFKDDEKEPFYTDKKYYDSSQHNYIVKKLPEGKITIIAHDQAGNYKKFKFIAKDQQKPKKNEGYVFAPVTSADNPQQINVNANLEDDWSGLKNENSVIKVDGFGQFPANITTIDEENLFGKLSGNFLSPESDGAYPVSIIHIKDYAKNECEEIPVGTLTVEPKKPENPSNPDESYDVYFSTLTHTKAPRFGPTKVAILKTGYVYEMSDLLATFGEASDIIAPENFSPDLASKYPLLIIPSAGLANQTNTNLQDKLTEYVNSGGNLIVMTQPTDTCYKLLPDKVESLGYFQDKACYYATAGIRKYNYAMAGQSDITVDGTADGVITSWPDGAETWLYRLKNNFPALLCYQHGKGRVVVSNYYSDYAHGHSQLNQDEKNLLRDLISWGRDFAQSLPEIQPGESVKVTLPVNYLVSAGGQALGNAAKVRLILRSPDRNEIASVEYPMDTLAPGGSVNLDYQFNDQDMSLSNQALGIWWVNYEILDADGNVLQAEAEGQRVAVSKHLSGVGLPDLAVTINSPVTAALEGTKIPFTLIARNNGQASQSLSYKVYAVLYTLVSSVQDEKEVASGTLMINAHDANQVTTELTPFKAYASTGGNTWDKNWWRFDFFDESGKKVFSDFRGVSGYRPAAEVKYGFRNLTNPDAVIFKASDQVGLDLQIASLVPVGYPVDWEVAVKAKNKPQDIVFHASGSNILDPVISPFQVFTLPENFSPDSLTAEVKVKYNGLGIPLVQNRTEISYPNYLNIKECFLSSTGANINVLNPNSSYTDFTIRSYIYDNHEKMLLDNYQSGGVQGRATTTIKIPYQPFSPFMKYRVSGYYMTFPTWHAEYFEFYMDPSQGALVLKKNTIQQNLITKKVDCDFSITNPGLLVSGAQLKASSKGLNYVEKFNLPDIKEGETISFPVTLNLPSDLAPEAYPIKFSFIYNNGAELFAMELSPKLTLGQYTMTSNGVATVLHNDSPLYTDYQLSVKVFDPNNKLVCEKNQTGFINGQTSLNINIPVDQINPFIPYRAENILTCPASVQKETSTFRVEPYSLKVILDQPTQTALNNKIKVAATVTNQGSKEEGVKLRITIPTANITRDFELPSLGKDESSPVQQTFDITAAIPPGNHQVQFLLVNSNGVAQIFATGFFTVLPPKLAITGPDHNQFKSGDPFGITIQNTGVAPTDFTYDLKLFDHNNKEVDHQTGSASLAVNEKTSPSWQLSNKLASDNYYVYWTVKTSPVVRDFVGCAAFAVQGTECDLTVTTDHPVYSTSQPVLVQTVIQNKGSYPVPNSNLDLTITRGAQRNGNSTGAWPCSGGDNQHAGWSKLPGNIINPTIRWQSKYPATLAGDLDGNGLNEIVCFGNSEILILDGKMGITRHQFAMRSIFPDSQDYSDAVLTDINNDGLPEVVACFDGKYLVAIDGNADLIWSNELPDNTLTSQYLAAADLDNDETPEIFLDNVVLNGRTGAVVKTDVPLGAIGDINNDGELEIVSANAVYDSDFNVISDNSVAINNASMPVLADLNGDGYLEIIFYTSDILYVFDNNYQPLWSYPLKNIRGIAAGDLDNDGKQEIVVSELARSHCSEKVVLDCFSSQGAILWHTESDGEAWYGGNNPLVIADLKHDQHPEVIMATLGEINTYDGQTGQVVWTRKQSTLYNYSNCNNSLILGDVDGDDQTEIIGWACIDDITNLPRQTPEHVAAPLAEVDKSLSYRVDDSEQPKMLVLKNGTLMAVGNQCVSYYIPSGNRYGVIPMPTVDPRDLTLRDANNRVEVLNVNSRTLIGVVDPFAMTYTPKGIPAADGDFYLPKYIKNGKYYQTGYHELYYTDLTTGARVSYGNLDVNWPNIIGIVDDSTILISYYDQQWNLQFARVNPNNLSLVALTISTDHDAIFSNSAIIFDDNGSFYRFDPTNNLLCDITNDCIGQIPSYDEFTYDNQNMYFMYSLNFQGWYNSEYPEYHPGFYCYNVENNNFKKLNSLKEYGAINGLVKLNNRFYFMLDHPMNGIFCFDPDTKTTTNYSLPSDLRQRETQNNLGLVYKTIVSPGGKIYLWVNEALLRGDQYNDLFCFNPTEGTWQRYPLFSAMGMQKVLEIGFGNSEDELYVLGYDDQNAQNYKAKLLKYQLSTSSLTEIDSLDINIPDIFSSQKSLTTIESVGVGTDTTGFNASHVFINYDPVNQRLYYALGNNQLRYLNLPSQTVNFNQIQDVNDLELVFVGAKGDNLYYVWVPNFVFDLSHNFDYSTLNLYSYSLSQKKFTLLSAIRANDLFSYYQYNQYSQMLDAYSLDNLAYYDKFFFDAENEKIYITTGSEIIGFSLNTVDDPTNNSSNSNSTSFGEETVAQQTFPITLAPNENQQLNTGFGSFAIPGSYTLKGKLTNELGQTLAEAQKSFAVSNGGLGIALDDKQRYFRPCETLNLTGQLINMLNGTATGLHLAITKKGTGSAETVATEDFDLAANENRNIQYIINLGEAEGDYLIEVKLSQDGKAVAQSQVLATVVRPGVKVEFDAPDNIGSQPFNVNVKLTNTSPLTLELNLNSGLLCLNEHVSLKPNETIVIPQELTVNYSCDVVLNVNGDVTGTYQHSLNFSESANVTTNLPQTLPDTTKELSFTVSNTGQVAAKFPVSVTLSQNGGSGTTNEYHVYLEPGQSAVLNYPVNLAPGNYHLLYGIANQISQADFTCLPQNAATMAAVATLTGPDELTIDISAANKGFAKVDGMLQITSDFANRRIPVMIESGAGYSGTIVLNNLPVKAGTYQVTVALDNQGQTLTTQNLSFIRQETVQPTADIVLTTVPDNLTGGVGQDLPITVHVKNNGTKNGDGIIELVSDSVAYADSQVVNLDPGTEQDVTFNVPIPEEFETGIYHCKIIVNGKTSDFTYQVNGYQLNATATLDKPAYTKGETAVLTLHVQNQGGQPNIPLTVRVKHGGFDEIRETTLAQGADLTFNIPADSFDQKIFYGFYQTASGRSLLLNVYNIYEALPEITVTTDKQLYHAGETITVNTQIGQEGWLAIAGPGDFHRFEKVTRNQTYQIPLPGSLKTGTYSVWVGFADKTLEHKIDVLGHDIRFVSGELNQTTFTGETPFTLHTVLTSGETIKTDAVLELVKPDGTSMSLSSQELNLIKGENELNFAGKVNSDQVGAHWLRVRIMADGVLIGKNDYAIQFGKEELLGITTVQTDYVNGTETVSGQLMLCGKGNGTVTLKLDGRTVGSVPAVINGSTAIPYNLLGSNITPGIHTLSAVYQGTGQTGTVTTKFTYGSGLPDLQISQLEIGKERDTDGKLPITVGIQKLNALPAQNIKVEVKCNGSTVGEFNVEQLTEANATYQQTINWDSGDFEGVAEFTVVVNADNSVREYDLTNNTATKTVTIPGLPKVSGLPKVTNKSNPEISGSTSPDALVFLYNDQGILDFTYADGGGSFAFTEFTLNEGENHLRMKARSQDGRESRFTDPFTIFVDSVPPEITIANISDGQFVNYDITPEIIIQELNPVETAILVDGQSWSQGNPISGEGIHQLSVHVVDKANNETNANLSFIIDKTQPAITITGLPENGGYSDHTVTPVVDVRDVNLEHTEMMLNGQLYNGETITEPGDYELIVTAYDKAGNMAEQVAGFGIKNDLESPVTIADYPSGWVNTDAAITLAATDNDSGVAGTFYRVDGGDWSEGTSILIGTEGTHTIEFYSRDLAGNDETVKSITIQIDKTAPLTSANLTGQKLTDGSYQSQATVALSAADSGGSGVAGVYYRLGNSGNYLPYTTPIIIDQAGTYQLFFYAADKAGNRETPQQLTVKVVTSSFNIDYSLLCKKLTVHGRQDLDRVFVDGPVCLDGFCHLDYLGTTEKTIQKKGLVKIDDLKLKQPYQELPLPDWEGLKKTTGLRTERTICRRAALSNARYQHSLLINGPITLSGIIVVEGNLTVRGRVTLNDVAIFCTGKLEIDGDVKGDGLIYAGRSLVVRGDPRIDGTFIVNGTADLWGSLGRWSYRIHHYFRWFNFGHCHQ